MATRKLQSLAPAGIERLRIQGDARKFADRPGDEGLTRAFAAVPKRKEVPGLQRPVLLERGRYYDAMATIWQDTGTTPEKTSLWRHLRDGPGAAGGARCQCSPRACRERTFGYEENAIRALGERGALSDGLSALLQRLG